MPENVSGASTGGSAAAGGRTDSGPRASGTRSVDSKVVEGDLPRPAGTMSNREITQTWDGLGSTGGATGTGVGVGTTASPEDGAPAQRKRRGGRLGWGGPRKGYGARTAHPFVFTFTPPP